MLREQLLTLEPLTNGYSSKDSRHKALRLLANASQADRAAVFRFCQQAYTTFLHKVVGSMPFESLVFRAEELPMDPCLQVLLDVCWSERPSLSGQRLRATARSCVL